MRLVSEGEFEDSSYWVFTQQPRGYNYIRASSLRLHALTSLHLIHHSFQQNNYHEFSRKHDRALKNATSH